MPSISWMQRTAVLRRALPLIQSFCQEKEMRSLFIVVSKVYGLIQVYTGLGYIFTVIPLIRIFGRHPGLADTETTMQTTFHGEQITLTAISLGAMMIFTFGVAWLLIFRADWLANKLKIPPSDSSPSPSTETLLYAGTKLIGLFVIVQGVPILAEALFEIRHIALFSMYMWSTLTLPAVRIIIGVLLVMKTQPIVNFIMKEKRQNQAMVATS